MFTLVKTPSDYIIYAGISVFAGGGSAIFNMVRAKKYVNIKLTHKGLSKHFFPMLILFGSAITTVIYVSSDTTMLGIFRNDYEVGLYSAASKIYTIVKQTINAALIVSVPRISYYIKQSNTQKINNLLDMSFEVLMLVCIPAGIGLAGLSENIITMFCGEEYIAASQALLWLSFALLFALLAGFFSTQILIPYRYDRELFFAVICSALLNVVLNFILIPKYGFVAAAWTTFVAELFISALYFLMARKIYTPKIKRSFFAYILEGVLVYLICKFSNLFFQNNFYVITVAILLSFISYLIILYFTHNELFFSFINRRKSRTKCLSPESRNK